MMFIVFCHDGFSAILSSAVGLRVSWRVCTALIVIEHVG
jgi:hypothetical protein